MASEQALLGGRYELGELLGRGGMATVRRGMDRRLGRPVAVKQLGPTLAADPICQARFQREARSSASLSHPSIVAVFDTGAQSDPDTGVSIPFLVMELVDGRTLRELLRSGGKVAPQRALELTRDVLEALGHSHEAGIVHRDIKPANVMVTATGGVKVMDFGIARAVAETSTDFTQTASVVGTAHYLSPEQARGEKVGFRSDLYSTGCLLYELLTGRPPFVGESVLSVIYQQVREAPVPPSELDPAISPAVDSVVLTALAKDPADRYASARQMRADIDRVLAGDEPAASPVRAPAAEPAPVPQRPVEDQLAAEQAETDLERAGRPRRRGGLALGSALLALLMVVGGYGLYRTFVPQAAAGQLVQVPDLLGRSRSQAEQAIREGHLTARLRLVRGRAGATVDTVVRQSPTAGRDAQPGSVVTVDINDGPATTKVPTGLVGRDVAGVRDDLKAAGFTDVRVEQTDSPPAGAGPGEVLAVDPGEGEPVALSHQIVLRVALATAAGSPATARPTTSGPGEQAATAPPQHPVARSTHSESPATGHSSAAPPTTRQPSRSPSAPNTTSSSTAPVATAQPSTVPPSTSTPPRTSKPRPSPRQTSTPAPAPSPAPSTAPKTKKPKEKPPTEKQSTGKQPKDKQPKDKHSKGKHSKGGPPTSRAADPAAHSAPSDKPAQG